MIKVKNYSSNSIIIDGVTIPSYGSALFSSFTDYTTVNKLLAQNKISITNAKAPVPETTVDTQVSVTTEIVPKVTEDVPTEPSVVEEQTDVTKTTTSRKRKSKNVDAEAEKSNLEKGDITDATD